MRKCARKEMMTAKEIVVGVIKPILTCMPYYLKVTIRVRLDLKLKKVHS